MQHTDLFRAALLACALPPWRRPITTVVSGLNLAEGLAVGGGMAYVATGHERKVLRFDLSNPASPAHVLANTWRDAYGLALAVGDLRLYVAENTGHRVRLITFEPPAVPTGVKASVLNGRAIVEWRHDGAKTTGFTAAYTANGVPSLLCHAPAGGRAPLHHRRAGGRRGLRVQGAGAQRRRRERARPVGLLPDTHVADRSGREPGRHRRRLGPHQHRQIYGQHLQHRARPGVHRHSARRPRQRAAGHAALQGRDP